MRVLYIPKKHDHEAHSEPMTAKSMPMYAEAEHNAEHEAHAEETQELILPDGMDRVIADVMQVMENKPETWKKYESLPNGLWETIRMESREVEKAYLAMKQGEGTHKDFTKELLHLGTAVLMAYKKMTCDK